MKNYSVQSILDWLETKNYLTERRLAEAFILTHSTMNKLPLYIHVLMGIGAIIGCFCIIGLLIAADLISFNQPKTMLISSMVCIIIALSCYYLLRYQTILLKSFGLQYALIFMVVGKVLFVLGFSKLHFFQGILHSDWVLTLGILIVAAPTYFIFPNQIDRFLSSFALLLAMLSNSILYSKANTALFVYFIALICICGLLYLWRKKSLHWVPIGYAVVLTLLVASIFLVPYFGVGLAVSLDNPQYIIAPIFFNVAVGIGLIILFFILGHERNRVITMPIVFACLGVCLLTITSTPGILVSMGLLILGYAKHEKAISFIGGFSLCLFLVAFYYFLPYTLEYKSALLVSTGVILLSARFIVQAFKWDEAS